MTVVEKPSIDIQVEQLRGRTTAVEQRLERHEEQYDRDKETNRQTHSDLYSKLDRPPIWATLLLTFFSGLAGAAIMAASKGGF